MELLERAFEVALDSPEGIKKLRGLILSLAMQGKLVPPSPDDIPARVLLKTIGTERHRRINEGKMKAAKPLRPIKTEDLPFSLPHGWEWVRLGDVAEAIRGVTYPKSQANAEPFRQSVELLRANNIQRNITLDETVFVPESNVSPFQILQFGDILIAMSSGSPHLVGKAAQFTVDKRCTFGAFCAAIRPFEPFLFDFVDRYCQSPLYRAQTQAEGKGIGIQNLNKEALLNLLLPLPPLHEQRDIVSRIDELMKLCDELERLQAERTEKRTRVNTAAVRQLLNVAEPEEHRKAAAFIGKHFEELYATKENVAELRKAILQLAVMGKLVPQDPTDPPARELLKQIEAEKKQLIEQRRIKAQKELQQIDPESIPFPIPSSWAWIRFGNVTYKITDGTHHTPKYAPDGVPFLSVKDMSTGALNFDDTRFITESEHKELIQRCDPQKGDLLITKVGTTGIPVLVDTDRPFSIFVSVSLIKYPQHYISGEYLKWTVNSPLVKKQSEDGTEGVGNKNLVLRKIQNFILPLPPLAEQKRIVAKTDQLMALCDTLERQIDDAGERQSDLLNAFVAQIGGWQCA